MSCKKNNNAKNDEAFIRDCNAAIKECSCSCKSPVKRYEIESDGTSAGTIIKIDANIVAGASYFKFEAFVDDPVVDIELKGNIALVPLDK